MKLFYSYTGSLHPYISAKDTLKHTAPCRQSLTIQYPEVVAGVVNRIYQTCRHVALGMCDRIFWIGLCFMLFVQNQQSVYNSDCNFGHFEKGGIS